MHYHLMTYRSDGSIQQESVVWSEHKDAVEDRLSLMLADGRGRVDARFHVDIGNDAESWVGPLAEPRRVQASNNSPLYANYRIKKCSGKKCESKEAAAKAAAPIHKRSKRGGKKNRRVSDLSYDKFPQERLAVPNLDYQVEHCSQCGSQIRPLEDKCCDGRNLTESERKLAALMSKSPERLAASAAYRMFAEAGHRDPIDSN